MEKKVREKKGRMRYKKEIKRGREREWYHIGRKKTSMKERVIERTRLIKGTRESIKD